MNIRVNEHHDLVLGEVFNPVVFETSDDEAVGVVMRDSGFELSYIVDGKCIIVELKEGNVIAHEPRELE
jgi:hypothetical protein